MILICHPLTLELTEDASIFALVMTSIACGLSIAAVCFPRNKTTSFHGNAVMYKTVAPFGKLEIHNGYQDAADLVYQQAMQMDNSLCEEYNQMIRIHRYLEFERQRSY